MRETVVTTWLVAGHRGRMGRMKNIVTCALLGVVMVIPHVIRHVIRVAFDRGVRSGYHIACARVFDSINGTTDLAIMADEMGEPMDVPTFTIMLAERLSVSMHADITLAFDCEDDCEDGE